MILFMVMLMMWENASYRMQEEERRRRQHRAHVASPRASRPPRMVGNVGGVDIAGAPPATIASACTRHGLTTRPWVRAAEPRPRVFDVLLLDGPALDLLEVRLRELDASVDRFIVVEGRRSPDGRRKPTFFGSQRGSTRFAPYRRKLLYYEVPEAAYPTGKTAGSAAIDRLHRAEMRAALELAGVQPGDVVLAADADEIPSASSLGLFIGCEGWPSNATTVGLSLERFVFSYYLALREEDSQHRMPTARVSTYSSRHAGAAVSRGVISRSVSGGGPPVVLAEAGWQCSCCFRALGDFRHGCSDAQARARLGSAMQRADEEAVQRVLCGGKPEAAHAAARPAQALRGGGTSAAAGQSALPSLQRRHGVGGLPAWLGGQSGGEVEFLLPGHCERPATPDPSSVAEPPLENRSAATKAQGLASEGKHEGEGKGKGKDDAKVVGGKKPGVEAAAAAAASAALPQKRKRPAVGHGRD